jgi:hypothetical protein
MFDYDTFFARCEAGGAISPGRRPLLPATETAS